MLVTSLSPPKGNTASVYAAPDTHSLSSRGVTKENWKDNWPTQSTTLRFESFKIPFKFTVVIFISHYRY